MTGPSLNEVAGCLQEGRCEEVHPGVVHFIWATTKALEEKKAAAVIPQQRNGLLDADLGEYADFIPDAEEAKGLTDYQSAVNAACTNISFEEIFRALQAQGKIWKTERDITSWRGDSNKFMCPDPSHDNPGDSSYSAWGTKEKGVWTCSKGCGVGNGGGDKYTLASYLFDEWDFHKLADQMAATFRGVRKPDPVASMAPPVQEEKPAPANPVTYPIEEVVSEDATLKFGTNKDGSVKVTVIGDDLEGWIDEDTPDLIPDFDWKATLACSPAHGTFLEIYCTEMERDTTPTQFNLFNGLVALGMVAGEYITSPDFKKLSANFGIVYVAPSGGGKSRSNEHLRSVLERADPYGANGLGTKLITSPGSGQHLVKTFINEETNPVTKEVTPFPVKGLVRYDELSELVKGGSIQASNLREKIHALIDHQSTLDYGSMASGTLIAHRPFGSIITSTQNSMMRELFSRTDAVSGFMNRFMFVYGTPKRQLARGEVPINYEPSIEALRAVKAYCLSKGAKSLLWTEEADAHLEFLFRSRIEPIKKADKRDILTRLDLNFKRLVLAFAINEKSDKIEKHHVDMAESMLPYLIKCYGGAIAQVGISESNEIADWCHRRIAALELKNYNKRIEEFKEANPNAEAMEAPTNYGVTVAQLKREYRKKNWRDVDVMKAIKDLKESNIIVANKGESQVRKGPQTTYYYAVEQYEGN